MQLPQLASLDSVFSQSLSMADLERNVDYFWEWLVSHSLEIVIAIAVGTLLYAVLGYFKTRAARYGQRHDDRLSLPAIIARTLSKTGHFFMFMVSAKLVVGFARAPDDMVTIVNFLFTVSVAFQAAIWLREIILGLIERRAVDDEVRGSESLANALALIRILISVAIFAIAGIVVLDNLGVNVTGLVAGLGVGGIAIGLAAQGIFSDLFAALSIIFDEPFKRGETIGYDNTVAKVEKVGLKSARLRSLMGEEIIISNTNLLSKEIINYTRLDRRRTRYMIGVIYQTPPEKARLIPDMLKEIIEAHGAVFIRCGFVGFGASSLDFQLDFDIMSSAYEPVFQGRHAIGLAIVQKFNDEGLEFAYPTQTTFTAAPDGEMILPYPEGGYMVHPEP
jgi:small-conductance mechanosensitive channel